VTEWRTKVYQQTLLLSLARCGPTNFRGTSDLKQNQNRKKAIEDTARDKILQIGAKVFQNFFIFKFY